MTAPQPYVFISYSHKDEAWKDRLVSHLRVLELEGVFDVWDDRRIAAGDEWRPEIEQAIERATVAILIVSKDFLTSRFIREQELTKILAGRTEGRLQVIPLIAEPCAWQAVSVLRGLQARPRDGRPLSAGSGHQIDEDLKELAVEVMNASGVGTSASAGPADARTVGRGLRVSRPTWLLAWLGGSGLLAALLTVAASRWQLDTFVRLDLVTERVSFVVRGVQQHFDPGVEFSRLTIERCASATFEGVDLVDASSPSSPRPTRLTCRDPDAKITLESGDDPSVRLGTIPAMNLEPGTTVAISVADGRVPVLTLELSGHQFTLDVPIDRDLDVVTDLVDVQPTGSRGTPGLTRFAGTRSAAPRHGVRLETSDRGAVLVAALPSGSPRAFRAESPIAVDSIGVDKETVGGFATTALLGDGSLSYIDYPAMSSLLIPKDRAVRLERLTKANVQGLRLESVGSSTNGGARPVIRLTVEGELIDGQIGRGDPGQPEDPNEGRWSDPRLTVYDVLTHGRLRLAALAAGWTVATLWAAYLGSKKLWL